MKKLLLIAGFIASGLGIFAQSEYTALEFSTIDFGGTSRYNGMAGAFGALGGDVSVLSLNPAGIGLFRRSEFTITPAFQINNVSSTYLGNNAEDIKANFNLNNIAYVVASTLDEEDGWKGVQFGLSYNRLKDFHSNESIIGSNAAHTFVDQIVDQANGTSDANFEDADPIFLHPAWMTYLFDPVEGADNTYESNFIDHDVKQVYTKETSGRIGETALSFGSNYNNRLYIGATLGFSRIKNEQITNYSETSSLELDTNKLYRYSYNETKTTSGDGFNAKIGLIYRVNDNLRAGIAYHTPNFMTFRVEQSTKFAATNHDGTQNSHSSPTALGEYNVSSPSRLIASMAFILGKNGLIDVDYEYANYRSMRLRSRGESNIDFSDANQAISDVFVATHNVRAGAEIRLQPFSLRFGTAYYQNPNKSSEVVNHKDKLIYTAGMGYRRGDMYLDFAYKLSNSENDFFIYKPSYSEVVSQKRNGNSVSLTWGMRF